jgi:tRNA(His) 5'-end guanylyltransferase
MFDKIKDLEKNTPPSLRPDHWTILLINGECFGAFTKGFDRPSDTNLNDAMISTSIDLMEKFYAITSFTSGDEIILLIPPTKKDNFGNNHPMIFSGNKQKLESLSSGLASARFNWHLANSNHSNIVSQRKKQKMTSGIALFNSSAIMVATLSEAEKIMKWKYDYYFKEGITALALTRFSKKMLHGKNCKKRLAMAEEKGIDLKKIPTHLFFGTWCKRIQKPIHVVSEYTGQEMEQIKIDFNKYSVPLKKLPQPFDLWLASKYDGNLE